MGKGVYWLSDLEWARIEPLLPRGRRGAHRVDDRRVISGIVHMLRTGAPWRTCPAVYGPYTTVYNRFNRWSRQGIWLGMFKALTGQSQQRLTELQTQVEARSEQLNAAPGPATDTSSAVPAGAAPAPPSDLPHGKTRIVASPPHGKRPTECASASRRWRRMQPVRRVISPPRRSVSPPPSLYPWRIPVIVRGCI